MTIYEELHRFPYEVIFLIYLIIYACQETQEICMIFCLLLYYVQDYFWPRYTQYIFCFFFSMIHGMRIKDGKATYVSRYVKTSRLKQEEFFGAPKFMKVGNKGLKQVMEYATDFGVKKMCCSLCLLLVVYI